MDHGKWSSCSYGKRIMDTKGPFYNVTRRVNPDMHYGAADRAYRSKFLKDQVLSPRDSVTTIHDLRSNPDYQKARFNIVRRVYQAPLNYLEFNVFRNFMSKEYAYLTRFVIARGSMAYVVLCGVTYYFMYNSNQWYNRAGAKVYHSRRNVFPGDPEWDNKESLKRTKPQDYAALNFKDSPI